MTSYRCLVITKFENRESPEKLQEEVAGVMGALLVGGTAVFGWQDLRQPDAAEPGGAVPPHATGRQPDEPIAGRPRPGEDVVFLKDWTAANASQVEAVILRNGDVHMLASVTGERPATVLKDGAGLRKYDRDTWSHFLEAEAKNRGDKAAVKVTFDDRNNLLGVEAP